MRRPNALRLVSVFAIGVGVASCGSSALFSDGDSDDNTLAPTGTTATGSGTGSGSGTETGTTTGTGVGTGGVGGGGATGGGGTGGTGGPPQCAHDECAYGAPLEASCSPCATAVCTADAFCCNNAGGLWDYHCIDIADETCTGKSCDLGHPSCDDTFGTVNDYHPCMETEAMCAFGFNNIAVSCGTICANRGTECLYAYDNQNQTYCVYEDARTCDFVTGGSSGDVYNVCVCARGCGNGPPCPGAQVCSGGTCG